MPSIIESVLSSYSVLSTTTRFSTDEGKVISAGRVVVIVTFLVLEHAERSAAAKGNKKKLILVLISTPLIIGYDKMYMHTFAVSCCRNVGETRIKSPDKKFEEKNMYFLYISNYHQIIISPQNF
jgi:hypothetical protein